MDAKSLLLQAAALLQQAHIKTIESKSNAVEEIVDARDCVEAALIWPGVAFLSNLANPIPLNNRKEMYKNEN